VLADLPERPLSDSNMACLQAEHVWHDLREVRETDGSALVGGPAHVSYPTQP
jgi:hypothetical protein